MNNVNHVPCLNKYVCHHWYWSFTDTLTQLSRLLLVQFSMNCVRVLLLVLRIVTFTPDLAVAVTLVELKPNVLRNPMNLCDLPWGGGGGWGASWGFPWFARQGSSFVTRKRVSHGSDRVFWQISPWRSKKFRQHQRGRQLAAPFDLKKPLGFLSKNPITALGNPSP